MTQMLQQCELLEDEHMPIKVFLKIYFGDSKSIDFQFLCKALQIMYSDPSAVKVEKSQISKAKAAAAII